MKEFSVADAPLDKLKFLFYGQAGTGKTRAAHTAPDPIYTLVLGPANELNTLASPDFQKLYGYKKIYFDAVEEEVGERGIPPDPRAFDRAGDALDEILRKNKEEDLGIQTIIVDNVTVLLEFAMNKVLTLGASGSGKSESAALIKLRKHNILIPADYDYKSQMSLISQVVEWLYKLPFHIILIAHEYQEMAETGDEASGRHSKKIIAHLPLFTGRHRTYMPRHFDNVWRFTVEGNARAQRWIAQTAGSTNPTVVAKTRVNGVVPFLYEDVNLEEAISLLQGVTE